jgi:FG-GAP-like repeat
MSGQEKRVALLVVTLLLVFSLTNPANAATAGFKPAVTYPVGTAPVAVTSGDFNGDGKADLAVANNGDATAGDDGGVSILLGRGDGTFQPANNFAAGKNPFAIATADFNGDGRADLVLIDSSGVGVLLGNGDGTLGPVTYFATAGSPVSLAVADFDGDNKPDLVVATYASLSVLLGNGDGTFQTHVDYSGSGPGVVAADLNGDGKMDVITGTIRSVAVRLGNGDGTFQNAMSSPNLGLDEIKQVVVADFNPDGKPDAAVSFVDPLTNSNGTFVVPGNGDGTLQQPSATLSSFGVIISVADFNGDGKADLVTVSGGNINLFLGNGDGTLLSALNFPVSTGPWGGAAEDFNHDKAPDLAVTNSSDNTVSILLNTGIDFSISASALNPGTVSRGQSSTSTVTLSLLNAFDNPVALTCAVQPAQAAPTCSLDQDSVTFDTNGNATATLTIHTAAAAALLAPRSPLRDSRPLQALWLPVVGFAVMGAGFGSSLSIKRKLTACVLGGILFSGLILQAACGGGSGGPHSQTYTVTVTGASGSTQHSATTTLTVQ